MKLVGSMRQIEAVAWVSTETEVVVAVAVVVLTEGHKAYLGLELNERKYIMTHLPTAL